MSSASSKLQSLGKLTAVGVLIAATAACAGAPNTMDRPDNSEERVGRAALGGAVLGVLLRDGNTEENLIAAGIGAFAAGFLTHRSNMKQQEFIDAHRLAGIQAIELETNRRGETRVLLTLPAAATHYQGAGQDANANMTNSLAHLRNVIEHYPLQSYNQVEVIYTMPKGCQAELRQGAADVQSFLHSALNMPVGVTTMETVDGRLMYEDALQHNPNRSHLFGRSTGSAGGNPAASFQNQFRNRRNEQQDQSCDTNEGKVSAVINNLRR